MWYQVPATPNANIWNCKTIWKNDTLRNNPDATEILSLNHFITAKFTFARGRKLYAGALRLIKQLLSAQANIEEEEEPEREEGEEEEQ